MTWNDWRLLDPILIELWGDFKIPVRVIGERIGVTKNACIGRAHRLGLPKRPVGFQGVRAVGPRKPKHKKLAVKSASRVSQPVLTVKATQKRDARGHFIAAPKRDALGHFISTKPKPVEKPTTPDIGNLTILDLTYNTCRWPSGDRPPFLYCGKPPEPGLPYCAEHSAIAFTGLRGKMSIENRISARSKF